MGKFHASKDHRKLNFDDEKLVFGIRRFVGNIWCVGAGEPSSPPLGDANSAHPPR